MTEVGPLERVLRTGVGAPGGGGLETPVKTGSATHTFLPAADSAPSRDAEGGGLVLGPDWPLGGVRGEWKITAHRRAWPGDLEAAAGGEAHGCCAGFSRRRMVMDLSNGVLQAESLLQRGTLLPADLTGCLTAPFVSGLAPGLSDCRTNPGPF